MESVELGNRILGRHMEITRSSFYAGRGPCTSDLHGGMLYGIFKDLYQVDKNYGENFIRLVDSIPSIGASDFIDAYDDFARNDFNFEKKVARRNIAVIDGRTYKEKMQSATCNALGTLGIFSVNKTKEQAANVSNSIKEHFYRLTKRFYEENEGQVQAGMFGKFLSHIYHLYLSRTF